MHCYEHFGPNKLHFLVKMQPFIQLSPSGQLQVKVGYRTDDFFIRATGSNKHLSTETQAHGVIRSYDYFPGRNVRGNRFFLEDGKEVCGTLAN